MKICSIEGCGKKPKGTGKLCSMHAARKWRHGDPNIVRNGHLKLLVAQIILQEIEGCIYWPHSRDNNGYAQFRANGRNERVHRFVCREVYGPPPSERHCAAHSCGNGHLGCVNPSHLRWATPLENQRDRIKHGTRLIGVDHPASKLTETQVKEILSLKGTATQAKIAERYGVCANVVSKIHRGISWTHITQSA